jgi:hypothetical protein
MVDFVILASLGYVVVQILSEGSYSFISRAS